MSSAIANRGFNNTFAAPTVAVDWSGLFCCNCFNAATDFRVAQMYQWNVFS